MALFKNSSTPYRDPSLNTIYEMLFCDQLNLYKNMDGQAYPWNTLFSQRATPSELQQIAIDNTLESRAKLLACHRLQTSRQPVLKRELLTVIIEVGLDGGLDVLASYHDGTARYINHSERMIVWETTTAESNHLTSNLFNDSVTIVSKIGPWDGARRPAPPKGNVRISFLVSDGLYFGEGPVNILFNDPMASPALMSATKLMQYLTEKSLAAHQ